MNKNKKAFSLIELSIVLLIIGIISASAIKGKSLIYQAKISNAKSATANAPINDISNLVLWLETTTSESINRADIDSNNLLSVWNDLSSNSYILNQANSVNKPTYVSDAINGLPAVRFAGDDKLLSTIKSNISGNPNFTIFVVGNISGGNNYGSWISFGEATSGKSVKFGRQSSNNVIFAGFESGGQNYNHGTSVPYGIYSWVRKSNAGANNNMNGNAFYYNGVNKTISNEGSTIIPNITNGFFYIGSSPSSNYIIADIGEVIVFNQNLKDSQRLDVERYLSEKWKININ